MTTHMSVRKLAKRHLLANFPLPGRLQECPQNAFGCRGHVRVLDGAQRVRLRILLDEYRGTAGIKVLYMRELETRTFSPISVILTTWNTPPQIWRTKNAVPWKPKGVRQNRPGRPKTSLLSGLSKPKENRKQTNMTYESSRRHCHRCSHLMYTCFRSPRRRGKPPRNEDGTTQIGIPACLPT